MTLKQLQQETKRHEKELARVKKNHEEMLAERGFSTWEKEIEYEEKMLKKYNDMYPEVVAAEEAKALKKIEKEQIANKASTIGFIRRGNEIYGITPKGLKWTARENEYGYTDRTLHCFTMYMGGKMIFTSGLFETVIETVAQN